MTHSSSPIGLPPGVVPYKKTPVFSDVSVPKGLLKDHATKAGVWGIIHVEEGTLEYIIPSKGKRQLLRPYDVGVVQPEELHHVKPIDGCRFYVEFWR